MIRHDEDEKKTQKYMNTKQLKQKISKDYIQKITWYHITTIRSTIETKISKDNKQINNPAPHINNTLM